MQTSAPDGTPPRKAGKKSGLPRHKKLRGSGSARGTPWSAIRHEFIVNEGMSAPELAARWDGKKWRGRVVKVSAAHVQKIMVEEGWVAMRDAHHQAAAALALEQNKKRLADLYDKELVALLEDLSETRKAILAGIRESVAKPVSDDRRDVEETETIEAKAVVGQDGPVMSPAKMVTKRVTQSRAPLSTDIAREVVRYNVEIIAALTRMQVGTDADQPRAVIE